MINPRETSMINAQYFLDRGFVAFPCNPDKSPKVSHWQTYILGSHIDEWQCYGIAIPKSFMVVDCDLYKSDEALASYNVFLNASGPSLMCVETGSGGRHLWYPVNPDTKIRKQIPEFPGIDFLTIGAYVIGPGSIAEKGVYTYKSGDLPYLKGREG